MDKTHQTALLDTPEVTSLLFYPRKESGRRLPINAASMDIPVAPGITVGARLYLASSEKHHILFFHGNGEIAEDYDDIGPVYTDYGISFIVVDYRGYGRSKGVPGVSAMIEDTHPVFNHVCEWLNRENRTGGLWVMGRSLGSASAIEIANAYAQKIDGLIIESGFAHTLSLLKRLGINTDKIGIAEDQVFSNAKKIACFSKPTLIIHAEYDQIIPLRHGEDLFDASPAKRKKFYRVPEADHNTLMLVSGRRYFETIRDFIYPDPSA